MKAVCAHRPWRAGGSAGPGAARTRRSGRARCGSLSRRRGSTSRTRWRVSASTRRRRSRRASSATRSRARSSRSGTGVDDGEGGGQGDGRNPLRRPGLDGHACPRDQVIPLDDSAQLRAGRGLPGQLRDRLRRTGDHGRASRGRARPDPRRCRRRRDLRDPDRPFPRRRDLRDCLGLKARCDPRAGSGPRDRLSDHGLRAGGQADHDGRGGRSDNGRHRPDELPEGLPRTPRGRPADHVRASEACDRAGAEHAQPGSKSDAHAAGDDALVEEPLDPQREQGRLRAQHARAGRTARDSTG